MRLRSQSARCLTVLACVFSLSFGIPLRAQADPGDTEYQLAREMYKQERWDLASERFAKFLKDFPQHRFAATARLSLALALVNQNDYQTAKAELQRFVKDHPTSKNIPDARYRIAECSYLMNDLKTAESEFTAFLRLAPQHELTEWALPYLGDTQLRLSKPRAAAVSFEESLERHPEGRMKDDASYGLARAYDSLGQTNEAFAIYKTLAADSESRLQPQAKLRIGLSLFNRGKYDESATAFDALVTEHAQNRLVPLAQLNAGYAYFQLEKHREAIDRFSKVGLTGNRGDTTSYWSARSHVALEDFDDAVRLLNMARKSFPESKLREQIEYLLGLALFRDGRISDAKPQLLAVADNWPNGPNADDSIHYATECAMLLGDWDEASQLVARFNSSFPSSPLKEREDVLGYRLMLNSGKQADIDQATAALRKLTAESKDQATQELARVYLAVALQEQEKHAEVVALLMPLIADDSNATQKGAALVMLASSQLALGNFQKAKDRASEFLAVRPRGTQAEQATSIRIMATARLGDVEAAEAELSNMKQSFGQTQAYLQARLEIAEQLYGEREWKKAESMFVPVTTDSNSESIRNRAVSGLAWSQYQTGNFDEAQKGFAKVANQTTNPDLVPESVFMRARCLEDSGRINDAIAAYQKTLDSYAPATAMKPTDELKGPTRRAYEAGKALARLTTESVSPGDADAIYERISKLFPNASDRDALLERWAFANVEAKNYERADEIFDLLLTEFPEGERADNARYQLAESELVTHGNIDKARKAFDELQKDTKVSESVQQAAVTQLIRIAVEARDYKATQEMTAAALKRFPDSPYNDEIELHQAETELYLRNTKLARSQLEELRNRLAPAIGDGHPTALRAELLWAEMLLAEKDYAALTKHVNEFRKTYPTLDVATEMLDVTGRAWKNQAEFEKARQDFQQVIDHPRLGRLPIAASSQFMIAETWFFENEYKKALDGYLVVKIKFKSLPVWQQRALYQIGQCDEALENWDKAAESYRELLKKYPESDYAESAQKRLTALESKLANSN